MAKQGVDGVKCSARLEPSPAESKCLWADRESLRLSSYGEQIATGVVVATLSFAHPPSCKQLQLMLHKLQATEGAIKNYSNVYRVNSGLYTFKSVCKN